METITPTTDYNTEQVQQRIALIEDPPIAKALSGVVGLGLLDTDQIVESITVNNPELVADKLGPALPHIVKTEEGVATYVPEIRDLTTKARREEHLDMYLNAWGPQEPIHGQATREWAARHLGIKIPEFKQKEVSRSFKYLGMLASLGETMARPLEFQIALHGSVNEQETITLYQKIIKVLRDIGEKDTAEKLFTPIMRQEGPHGRYGKAVAKSLWHKMSAPEKEISRLVYTSGFELVGVHDDDDKVAIGTVINSLTETDEERATILSSARDLAIRTMPRGRKLALLHDALLPTVESKITNLFVDRIEEYSRLGAVAIAR